MNDSITLSGSDSDSSKNNKISKTGDIKMKNIENTDLGIRRIYTIDINKKEEGNNKILNLMKNISDSIKGKKNKEISLRKSLTIEDYDYLKTIIVKKQSKIDYEKMFDGIYELRENYEDIQPVNPPLKKRIIRLRVVRKKEEKINNDNINNNLNNNNDIKNNDVNNNDINNNDINNKNKIENINPDKKKSIKEDNNINNINIINRKSFKIKKNNDSKNNNINENIKNKNEIKEKINENEENEIKDIIYLNDNENDNNDLNTKEVKNKNIIELNQIIDENKEINYRDSKKVSEFTLENIEKNPNKNKKESKKYMITDLNLIKDFSQEKKLMKNPKKDINKNSDMNKSFDKRESKDNKNMVDYIKRKSLEKNKMGKIIDYKNKIKFSTIENDNHFINNKKKIIRVYNEDAKKISKKDISKINESNLKDNTKILKEGKLNKNNIGFKKIKEKINDIKDKNMKEKKIVNNNNLNKRNVINNSSSKKEVLSNNNKNYTLKYYKSYLPNKKNLKENDIGIKSTKNLNPLTRYEQYNNIKKNEKNKAKNIPTKLLNKTTILNNNRYKEEPKKSNKKLNESFAFRKIKADVNVNKSIKDKNIPENNKIKTINKKGLIPNNKKENQQKK